MSNDLLLLLALDHPILTLIAIIMISLIRKLPMILREAVAARTGKKKRKSRPRA